MKLSVIICTYNPSPVVFNSCVQHVHAAVGDDASVEVIVVDNNSSYPVAEMDCMKAITTPAWKVLVEREQGLTAARLRGIQEARGELLVYVDDDNFVGSDFFKNGVDIASRFSFIGAFSGQVKLQFEQKPEEWTKRYWGLLVHREFDQDVWSNLPHLDQTMPCGAGLFVRKEVAKYYLELHEGGKRQIQLDRKGNSLFSGGDNDLAACACDLGFGVGLFHNLVLTHFIPAKRLTKPYLLALAKGIAASTIVFKSFRHEFPPSVSMKTRIANSIRLIAMGKTSRAFYQAVLDGEEEGRRILTQDLVKI